MIQHLAVQILHEPRVIGSIFFLLCYPVKDCRGVDRFRKAPVHPVMDHRLSLPVCCIYQSRPAVSVPRVLHCPVVKILRVFYITFRFLCSLVVCGKRPLCNQSCPFNSVSRCRAIRLKGICRAFFIVLQLRLPLLCKVLRDPPFIFGCPAQDMVDDPSCPGHPRNAVQTSPALPSAVPYLLQELFVLLCIDPIFFRGLSHSFLLLSLPFYKTLSFIPPFQNPTLDACTAGR